MLEKSKAKDCEAWLAFTGRQFCSPQFEKEDAIIHGLRCETLIPFPYA
jgi:hypothetical protein